jgi:hypothetical protein
MAATIELKYYNSFWLKKIKSITSVVPNSQVSGQVTQSGTTITIPLPGLSDEEMNVGQSVKILYAATDPEEYNGFIIKKISNTEFEVSPEPSPVINDPAATVIFGKIEDFTNIPKKYTSSSATPNEDWYIEEARIRGGYNNTTVDFGVKAYAVDASKEAETRSNALIYSGVYNSRTGINNTNQFSVAEDITKGVDPAYGSIQKLYAEDTNLIIFQENKVSRALIDKDAIYSAEGGGTVTSANVVIGQIVPYAGEYGISTDPESFAVYGYRKYFTDRRRNAVLRLSMDGIEEISRYGMTDFFRDTFNSMSASGKIIGGYDLHTKKYEVSILRPGQYTYESAEQAYNDNIYKTLSFDESVKGWTSFYTYGPDFMASLGNTFYSFKNGQVWKHYSESAARGTFYGYGQPSTVTFIFNPNVSMSKNFKTINYEGTEAWEAQVTTDSDTQERLLGIRPYQFATSLSQIQNDFIASNIFIKKENKYFANILNAQPAKPGEIVFGDQISGLKGFVATVTFSTPANTIDRELFAVSTEYAQSSY